VVLLNWSMNIAGYPPHTRSASRVVGVTHMSTFAAMRFLEDLGIVNGWLLAEGTQPQLERVRAGQATQVGLKEMFSERRVVNSEGLASGTVMFAASPRSAEPPPTDRSLAMWAESRSQPWMEMVDNETAYLGGLEDAHLDRLLAWFLNQRPIDQDWRKMRIDRKTLALLRHGLFEHGWTRNLGLVKPDRQITDLWGGIHRHASLEIRHHPRPTTVQVGLRLRQEFGEIFSRDILERCPLDDDNGKTTPR